MKIKKHIATESKVVVKIIRDKHGNYWICDWGVTPGDNPVKQGCRRYQSVEAVFHKS